MLRPTSKIGIDHRPGRRHEMSPAAVALVSVVRPDVLKRLIAAMEGRPLPLFTDGKTHKISLDHTG